MTGLNPDPEIQYYALEERLLVAPLVRGRADVRSTGLIEVGLEGEFNLRRGNVVAYNFSGRFAGDWVEPKLHSDGRSTQGGSLTRPSTRLRCRPSTRPSSSASPAWELYIILPDSALARRQTTNFPDGPMYVDERYQEFDIM